MMLPPVPMPSKLAEFYGQPWIVTSEGLVLDPKFEPVHITRIKAPYDLFYGEQKISKIAVNYACADSLLHCLERIGKEFTQKERAHYQLDRYGGCFNFRPIRGSVGKTTASKLSMHAYGAAIDLAPAMNPLGAFWNEGKGMMPLEAIEIFEKAGWKWGGRFQSRPDCMHFQFTQ
jgi:hypothetical protein